MQNKVRQAAEATTGATAAGNTILPYDAYSDYLVTHGFWVMSYADWSKVIGTVYIVVLILKTLGFFKLVSWLWNKRKAKK